MATGVEFDLTTFRQGCRAIQRGTKRTNAEILNRAGGSICANAIRLTPAATAQEIQSELGSDGTVFKLLLSKKYQHRLPKSLQGFGLARRTRAEIADAATRLIALRKLSRNYIKAGWFKALAVFRPNQRRRASEKGLAGQGRATKATESALVATFENYATGAGRVGADALQQALDEEGRNMIAYGEKEYAKLWK